MTTPIDLPAATRQELREQLAALCHEQWSGWMKHLFGRCYSTPDGAAFIEVPDTKRWQRQMCTPYVGLSEAEKESDRKEADRVLSLISESEVFTLGQRQGAQETQAALKWAERQLRALVTEDTGNGAFIRGTGTELAGFGAGLEKLRTAIAQGSARYPGDLGAHDDSDGASVHHEHAWAQRLAIAKAEGAQETREQCAELIDKLPIATFEQKAYRSKIAAALRASATNCDRENTK